MYERAPSPDPHSRLRPVDPVLRWWSRFRAGAPKLDQTPKGVRVAGVETESFGILCDRFVVPAQLGEHVAERDVHLRFVGTEADRLGKLLGRLLQATPPRQSRSKVVAKVKSVRGKPHRLGERDDRAVELSPLYEDDAEILMDVRVCRVDSDCLKEAGHPFVDAARGEQVETKVALEQPIATRANT